MPKQQYVVTINQPGTLPEREPEWFETLSEAKDFMRSERFNAREIDLTGFRTLTPLSEITRTELSRYGEITYGRYGDGYVLSIALEWV